MAVGFADRSLGVAFKFAKLVLVFLAAKLAVACLRRTTTRATGQYRYCVGDFGNGKAWRWHYSLSNVAGGLASLPSTMQATT